MKKEYIMLVLATGVACLLTFWGINGILKAVGKQAPQRVSLSPKVLLVPLRVEGIERIGTPGITPEVLKELGEQLKKRIAVSFLVEREVVVPKEAYSAERGQLDAERALQFLARGLRWRESEAFRVLFVTDTDLFVPGLNFVFGLAQRNGKFAVVSDARFGLREMGTKKERELYFQRLSKVTLHELGHTLGLPHVQDKRSVMTFANSLKELDESGDELTEQDKQIILIRHPILKDYLK